MPQTTQTTQTIYNYHPQSGEFVHASTADPSPLEPGVYLMPAYATDVAPPSAGPHEIAVFIQGAWQLKPDWRGVPVFKTSDGSALSIDTIGVTPAELQASAEAPPSELHHWQDGAWVIDPSKLARQLIKAKQQAEQILEAWFKQQRSAIADSQDEIQIAAWNNKLRIAQAYLAKRASALEQQALQVEINVRALGEKLDDFCQKIQSKAAYFAHANALIDGFKHLALQHIAQANTLEEINEQVVMIKLQSSQALSALNENDFLASTDSSAANNILERLFSSSKRLVSKEFSKELSA